MKTLFLTVTLFIFSAFSLISSTLVIEDLSKFDLKKIIGSAKSGDTVKVISGRIKAESIIINKPLVLLGINKPVIEGLGSDHIFKFKSDSITISGFSIINSGMSYVQDRAAIRLDSSDFCTIESNNFENCMFAIYAAGVSHLKVSHNVLKGNSKKESASGNGVHLWHCRNVIVDNNSITGHRDGIYLEFVQEISITNNLSFENKRYGLHFMFSHNAEYKYNTFKNNGSGVAVMYTKNVLMQQNKFINNMGSASYGLLLKDISNSKIIDNEISNNSTGLYVEGGGNNEIKNNTFSSNAWAIRILASSSGNTFERNNIFGNSFDVTTNSSKCANTFKKNYWDKYKGYDINRDGLGDVPYYPVRLFAYLVEKNPPLIILLHSFFVFLLEMAENIIPSIVPATLIDHQPLMQPYMYDKV